jgi:hypothetical protein
MTAEQMNEKGIWHNPKKRDNHLWDCEVMAAVAYDILGVKYWPAPEPEAEQQSNQQQIAAQSSYLTGGRR